MTKEEFDKIKVEQEAFMNKAEKSKNKYLESLSNISKNISKPLLDSIERQDKLFEPLLDGIRKKRELEIIKEEEYIYKQTIFLCGKVLETIDLPERIPNNLNLSDKQIKTLCQLLQEKEYISNNISLDMCSWLFGVNDYLYQLCEDFYKENVYNKGGVYKDENQLLYFSLNDFIENNFYQYTLTYLSDIEIEWIKRNSRTRQINKVSLLDLLNQLKVSFSMWHNKEYLNNLFTINGGEPINFNPQNFRDFDKTKYKSEYFNEISDIIELSKS